jgi:4-hydroxybenzoate polyprenyltransferase
MGKIKDIIRICRPQQWYKNLVIYLALIFTIQLFAPGQFLLVTYGFISLCMVSSANYVLNDIIDRSRDRLNPEKKKRPIAAGRVRVWEAGIVAAVLAVAGLVIAYRLSILFFGAAGLLLIFTQIYSLFLKNAVFVDILSIAVNFVIRAVAGALIINVRISPWLILCTFFLSLFLSAGKRASEVIFMGSRAAKHRETLDGYTKEITDMLTTITTTLLIISYSLYSFLSDFHWLLLTLPFALYTILRYKYLIITGSPIGRRPELAFTDWKMMAGIALWSVAVVVILQAG